jgi:Icc-related predicted phosphoesterase
MRLVFISDTHLIDAIRNTPLHVPDGDVLIHCGDATMQGSREEMDAFAERFMAYPHKHKIFVPGNHDWDCQNVYESMPHAIIRLEWAHVLIDRAVIIEGVKFYGSPWQPEFFNWAFNLPRGKPLAEKWAKIPTDTDVLVTHGPPMGVLDRVWRTEYADCYEEDRGHYKQAKYRREHVGCADLMARVKQVNPKVHAFGHIHCDYGSRSMTGLRTTFINCALADERYFLSHKPQVYDL